METAASPKGSSIPACSWAMLADGQRVCVRSPYKSWKTAKNPDRSMLFLFLFRQIFSVFPQKKYGVNFTQYCRVKRDVLGRMGLFARGAHAKPSAYSGAR